MSNTTTIGLRERIEKASSKKEIDTLLEEGKKYEFASSGTRNAWKNTARRVLRDKLGEKIQVEEVAVEVEEAFVSSKESRKGKKNRK